MKEDLEFPTVQRERTELFGNMRLQRDRLIWADGRDYHYEYRLASRPRMNVVAMTDSGMLLFVRQYRHPVREYTIELPDGGYSDSDPVWEVALRILREKTGHAGLAANVYVLGAPIALAPSAMQHQVRSVFIGEVTQMTSPEVLRSTRKIEPILLPARDVVRDPMDTLSPWGKVSLPVLGSLMLARRSIRDFLK